MPNGSRMPTLIRTEDVKTQKANSRPGRAGADSNPLLGRSGGEFRPRRRDIAAGRPTGRANHLHPGAVPLAIFLPERKPRLFQAGRDRFPAPAPRPCNNLARRHRVVIIASLFEKRAAGVYHNTAAIIDADGSLLGLYRKMHIPDDPLYYEKFYFTPGDLGFRAWHTRRGKIGVCICWDQWYPEAARLTALQGAEILFYPTAIGWHPAEKAEHGANQHSAWEIIQRSHAVANGCYRRRRQSRRPGKAGGRRRDRILGQSFVAAPSGADSGQGASVDQEEILLVPVDLAQVDRARTHWPFLRDRRIDAYGGLDQALID